ncbi:MAG: hypothetical protein ABIB79_05185 [archaeon]
MFPETSFNRFANENLMFVVSGGHIYHTESSRTCNGDYISLCGLFFPLRKSETLRNMEERYMQKNSDKFRGYKSAYAKSIKADKKFLNLFSGKLEENKNFYFFLSKIIPICIGKDIRLGKIKQNGQIDYILESHLQNNLAVINKRIYPLTKVPIPSVVKINGVDYFLNVSNRTVNAFEEEFRDSLTRKLEDDVHHGLAEIDEFTEELSKLSRDISHLVVKKHFNVTRNGIEYGDIGYDSNIKKVYHLLAPHYNKNTGKHYGKNQAAIGVDLISGQLSSNSSLLFRENSNSYFTVDYGRCCLGFSPKGNSPQSIVAFLRKAAINIEANRRVHE